LLVELAEFAGVLFGVRGIGVFFAFEPEAEPVYVVCGLTLGSTARWGQELTNRFHWDAV
jgi:hypothetical protein